jgi:hypothetical protein
MNNIAGITKGYSIDNLMDILLAVESYERSGTCSITPMVTFSFLTQVGILSPGFERDNLPEIIKELKEIVRNG